MLGSRSHYREGSFRVGQIVDVRLNGNTPVCDVAVAGNVYQNCQFATFGGGAKSFRYSPPAAPSDLESTTPEDSDGAEAILLFGDGARPHPLVVAVRLNTLARKRFGLVDAPDADNDYSDLNDFRDDVVELGDTRMLLSHHGDLVLDTKRSGRPIHAQMGENGAFRIAQNGDAAERTLLAGPSIDVINALVADVNALRQQVQALSQLIFATEAAGTAANAAGPAAVAAAVAAVLAAGKVGAYSALPETQKADDSVVASAVRISSRSKKQE